MAYFKLLDIIGTWIIFYLLCRFSTGDLSTFKSCCNVCKGDQDLWIQNNPDGSWVLSIDGKPFHDFLQPAAYITDEQITSDIELYQRIYRISYSGIPVKINETEVSESVLHVQYVQLDLTLVSNLAGVTVQGGHIKDLENDLFSARHTWVTRFAVSHSVDGTTFHWVRDSRGIISVFDGLTPENQYKMQDLGNVYTTRYVRIHPLGAQDELGATPFLMIRFGAVTCSMDTVCIQPRYPCILNSWEDWSTCTCDWAGCKQTRGRSVARYPACGGQLCDVTLEKRSCIPPEPAWKSAMKIVGIVIPILLVVIIVCVILYKKFKKEPEVFIKREIPKPKKEKKERKLRRDLVTEDVITDEIEDIIDEDGDVNDFLEKDIAPVQSKTGFSLKQPKLDEVKKSMTDVDKLEDEIMNISETQEKDAEIENLDELEAEIAETKPKMIQHFTDNSAPKPALGVIGQLDGQTMTVVGIDGKPVQKKKKKKKNKNISFALPAVTDNEDQANGGGLPELKSHHLPPKQPLQPFQSLQPKQPSKPTQPGLPSLRLPTLSAPKPLGITPNHDIAASSSDVDDLIGSSVETMAPAKESDFKWDELESDIVDETEENPTSYDDIFI